MAQNQSLNHGTPQKKRPNGLIPQYELRITYFWNKPKVVLRQADVGFHVGKQEF